MSGIGSLRQELCRATPSPGRFGVSGQAASSAARMASPICVVPSGRAAVRAHQVRRTRAVGQHGLDGALQQVGVRPLVEGVAQRHRETDRMQAMGLALPP